MAAFQSLDLEAGSRESAIADTGISIRHLITRQSVTNDSMFSFFVRLQLYPVPVPGFIFLFPEFPEGLSLSSSYAVCRVLSKALALAFLDLELS